MAFTIDPKYLVGIAQVDREHRRLFEIIDEVDRALGSSGTRGGNPERDMWRAIDDLTDYTRVHFDSEEGLMRAAGYPGLEAHLRLHADLLRQVEDIEMRIELDDESAILDFSRFLAKWLVTHIQSADRDFGRFVLARDGTPGAGA